MEPQEKTLLVTRPTRLISLRYYLAFILGLGLATALFLNLVPYVTGVPVPLLGWSLENLLAAFVGFLAFVCMLTGEVRRLLTRYTITDNRIIREEGILSKRTSMVPYTQLERVDVTQSFGQRILGIGKILVDTGDDSFALDMVRDPGKIRDLLSQRLGRRAYGAETEPLAP